MRPNPKNEELSFLFDNVSQSFVQMLGLTLAPHFVADWAHASWTWDDATKPASEAGNPSWEGKLELALRAEDFAGGAARCTLRINGHVIGGLLTVWNQVDGTFRVDIEPTCHLCEPVMTQWIESLRASAHVINPVIATGVQFRIGRGASTPSEAGGSLMVRKCQSVGEIIQAYTQWRLSDPYNERRAV
jgi:hypothetical protein